ncbi:DUF4199 domain-containing protein [Echinicola marina]|uniref:DUF4199 domain-containing protein n=1 Tax=Echinicola marina TaxID=2859768 RepID=UPI001CF69F2C|nr:DUF4199 domain-containing protein [Echinicola marina]UCS93407.1 DUF4199 domain-containing protein [Echinicola marina]
MDDQMTIGEASKKWGLIYGIIGTIIILISAMFDFSSQGFGAQAASGFLSILIAFGVYYFSTKEYREANSGVLSFGQGFKIVFLVGLIGGALRGLMFYIYLKVVDTEYVQRIVEAQIEAQEKMGATYDPDNVPAFMKFFQSAEFFAGSSLINALIGALIIGLIAVAINKRTNSQIV